MASPFLLAAGGFSQGLAQGAQAGMNMSVQYQQLQIEKQQANIATTQAMVNSLKIYDPAIRNFAVSKVMQGYGMDPASPAGKQFLKMVSGVDEPGQQQLVDGFAAAGVHLDPQMVGYMIQNDPMGTINTLVKFSLAKQANDIYSQSASDPTGASAGGGTTADATSSVAGGSVPAVGQAGVTTPPSAQPSAKPAAQPATTQQQPAAPQATQAAAPQQAVSKPAPAIVQASVAGLPGIKLDASGLPIPYDPNTDGVVQRLQTGINNLNKLVPLYPEAKTQADSLQKQLDTHLANMHSQYDEYIARINAWAAKQHVAIDWANVAIANARKNWDMTQPRTPTGQANLAAGLGQGTPGQNLGVNLSTGVVSPTGGGTTGGGITGGGGGGGGGTGGGGTAASTGQAPAIAPAAVPATSQAPAAPTGQTQAAPTGQGQQAAPTSQQAAAPRKFNPWGEESDADLGIAGWTPDQVKAAYPGAQLVYNPSTGHRVWQIPTPTSSRDAGTIDQAHENFNANATGYRIMQLVQQAKGDHPGEFATPGEIKSIAQNALATIKSLGSIAPITDAATQAVYEHLITYNQQIPALDALHDQVEFLVARQLQIMSGAGGGNMMGIKEAMEQAGNIVGNWKDLIDSPERVQSHLDVTQAFFEGNLLKLKSQLPTNSFADPVTNITAAPPPSSSKDTSQTTAPAAAPAPPRFTPNTPAQTQAQTAPTSAQPGPVNIPWQQIPNTGVSTYKNMGGKNPSQFIPNNFLKILLHNPNANARAYFDLNFGQGASQMVIGN